MSRKIRPVSLELIEGARGSIKECPTLRAPEFTAFLFSQGNRTVQRPGNDVVRSLIHGSIALLLAFNYFAFQVELFDDEYEENHPAPTTTCSITHPTLNWESFDKDNAL